MENAVEDKKYLNSQCTETSHVGPQLMGISRLFLLVIVPLKIKVVGDVDLEKVVVFQEAKVVMELVPASAQVRVLILSHLNFK